MQDGRVYESGEIFERDGGGGRIIRRYAPHPSGRCLRQRCLAVARREPSSKLLILPRSMAYARWVCVLASGIFERDGGGGRIIRRYAPHPSGRCLRQRCLAVARREPSSKLLILPRSMAYARWVCVLASGIFERDGGGGRIIRRYAPHPSGRCLRQRCLAVARREPSSKLLILPRSMAYARWVCVLASGIFERDGGGGRIRTFEVCDGRFTVCSLWPLGNPTTG